MNDKFRLLAIGLACVYGSFPQVSMAASPLKNSDFIAWERESQKFYIQTSVLMASLIVGQTSKQQGQCIGEWYSDDVDVAHEYIIKNMNLYPEDHPSGLILAVLEKKCGGFSYSP